MNWDEDNRLVSVNENGQEMSRALYDGAGERRVHLHLVAGQEETAYVDQHLVLRNGVYPTKHIFAGETRIASKIDADFFQRPPVLYYHPDHLGSTQYVSDHDQQLSQHVEYLPSGELWIDQTDSRFQNRQPYLFNGKELDLSTGLYYYGARSYEPRLGVWLSPDPILDEYMAGGHNGGVYNPGNLGLYTYALNNPVNLVDPDGQSPQGGGRNIPPGGVGMGGCRHPSCFNGPEGAAFHQRQLVQRMAESGRTATAAAATGGARRGIGDFMRRVMLRIVTQQQQQQATQPAVAPTPAAQQAAPKAQPAPEAAAKSPAPSAEVAKGGALAGSGPRGMVELSHRVKSSNYVKNFSGQKPVDFIYDHKAKVFRMANHPLGHEGLAQGSDSVVGGTIWFEGGVLRTNEHSGHFGHLWTNEIRAQFAEFMHSFGVKVSHSATW